MWLWVTAPSTVTWFIRGINRTLRGLDLKPGNMTLRRNWKSRQLVKAVNLENGFQRTGRKCGFLGHERSVSVNCPEFHQSYREITGVWRQVNWSMRRSFSSYSMAEAGQILVGYTTWPNTHILTDFLKKTLLIWFRETTSLKVRVWLWRGTAEVPQTSQWPTRKRGKTRMEIQSGSAEGQWQSHLCLFLVLKTLGDWRNWAAIWLHFPRT